MAQGNPQTPAAGSGPLIEPAWNWAKKYAGNGGPLSKDIVSDGNGNYYLTGNFNGSLTFNNITVNSSGTSDLFIVKVNSAGDALWIKKISASEGKSVIPCRLVLLGNGDFLVGGHFDGTAAFPANTLVSGGHADAFVARYDANGNNIWAGKYSDPESLTATGLAADANGAPYMTANVVSSMKSKIIIFSSTGQAVDAKTFNNSVFTDIACRNSNLSISGFLRAATSFGSINLSSGYYPSSFTGQTDLSGNFIWADNGKCASADSRGYSVAIDENGNTYTTGYFMDSIRFNPPATKLTAEGVFPLFIVKYSPTGTCLWASQIGDAEAYDYHPLLSLDNQGHPFVISYFYFGLVFGSTTLSGSAAFIASYSPSGAKQWAKAQPYFPNRAQFQTSNEIIECADNYFNTLVMKFDASANLLWTRQSVSDGGLSDVWYQMAVDHTGMPYIQGDIRGNVYFDGNPESAYGTELTKLNGDGSVIWQKIFSQPLTQFMNSSGVCTDLDNNCFAWGTFSDSLTIEGTLHVLSHKSGNMAYLAKYSKKGESNWVRTFEGYGGITGVGGITSDHEGNVILTGMFVDTLKINNIILPGNGYYAQVFIIKYNPAGSLVFAEKFGGTSTVQGRGASSDGQNNIYVTGRFNGTANFGGNYLTSFGSDDVFILKLDPDGNPVWVRQAGGQGYERGHAIITDSTGNSYISGLFWSTSMSFGNITITSPLASNLFIAKYASDGTPLWAHALQNQDYTWPAYQMGLDEEGSCYMGGDYDGSLAFDNGPTYTGNLNNNFLVKYDASGAFQWNKNVPQTAFSTGYSNLMSLAVYNKNSILIGGRIINDTLTLGNNKLYSCNSGAFIALLGDNLPMGVQNQDQAVKHIAVYPNPSHGEITIRFDDPVKKKVMVIVTDAEGKTLYAGSQDCGGTASVCLPHPAAGVYLVSVYYGGNKFSEKLLIY